MSEMMPEDDCQVEYDCILVDKVYDSCTQTYNVSDTFTPAAACTIVSCAVDLNTSTCTAAAYAPSAAGTDYSDVTFIIGAEYTITCADGTTITRTVYTTQVVTLYNPAGTTVSCTLLPSACSCVTLPTGDITCMLTLCVLFQSTAAVVLRVKVYGFCVPPVCGQVGPVLPCPPSPLYPPQANSVTAR